MNLPNSRREIRYGMPAADQIMFNRHYVLCYSYYFRQAKWALEIVICKYNLQENCLILERHS
jgi:endonuclease G, mitochondrial